MITTLSLEEIEKYADNIYEAIIVLARRARQINEEQKQTLFRETEEEYEDYDEELEEGVLLDSDYVRLPKPTSIALEEFLTGKLKFEYRGPSKEQEETE
ncbi:DNA-directed RNA polymerase subunit omega [candidate division KSB1 bacterium]|nr:DNA-directed RNA polymerase subunit omega [candidate division KSB1 bacterium]NIR72265.1 DNA-directed RNA polymerase subunit omega [candidate division KSB1 bacterium]NIS24236.1 DNA-directed RNA polymerase subunit omega [candidate division KSB1 bacterium]NIT71150.1 DNA-directed RNA polymerase subunit omega [candidate division KSB1 bacterium]NIU24855.1 DNA-directed RNA polymerase subunit omega [candidate division KSB1 bacterium]